MHVRVVARIATHLAELASMLQVCGRDAGRGTHGGASSAANLRRSQCGNECQRTKYLQLHGRFKHGHRSNRNITVRISQEGGVDASSGISLIRTTLSWAARIPA